MPGWSPWGRAARALEVEPLDELLIGGEAGDRDRHRVGDLGDQGPERHDHLHVHLLGGVDEAVGKGPPAQIRLGAVEEQQVALGARRSDTNELIGRPVDVARHPVGERDRRPVGLKVEELLGIELGQEL